MNKNISKEIRMRFHEHCVLMYIGKIDISECYFDDEDTYKEGVACYNLENNKILIFDYMETEREVYEMAIDYDYVTTGGFVGDLREQTQRAIDYLAIRLRKGDEEYVGKYFEGGSYSHEFWYDIVDVLVEDGIVSYKRHTI